MAKAYSDDLRGRFLSAYEQGEGTLEELAERFMVSLGYGKKLRQQWWRSGRMERVEQRRGTPRKLLDGSREQLRRWVMERSFAWVARFRRLARDYERLAASLGALHFLACACLMLANLFRMPLTGS